MVGIMTENVFDEKKTLIVYHYVAKYRRPIFDLLINDNNYDIASDIKSNNDIELVGAEFYQSDNFIKLNNFWVTPSVLWQSGLLSLIFSRKYNSVIFLGDPYFISTWVALILCRFFSIKSFLWTHGFVWDKSFKSLLKLMYYKLADTILLYGNVSKRNLISKNVPSKKLEVIYNSLDYENQKKIRELTSRDSISKLKNTLFPETRFQLVFVGRLTPQKKLHLIIDLVSKLKSKGYSVNMLFIGDGEEKEKLEVLTIERNLEDRIKFFGKTYDETQLCTLLSGSDLCISPGEVGLTAVHVMAYGVPVITHGDSRNQMPEFEIVQDGYTGLLYDIKNQDSLFETIVAYINNPINNVHNNCISSVEKKYTPKSQFDLITKVIRNGKK
jgi:glycosyltransferase involved in cell wall biosynthesis